MANLKIARRTVFTAGPLALLLAGIERRVTAAPEDAPRRFVTLFTPNGLNYTDAGPSGGESDFSFGDYYDAFEPHRADLIAFSQQHIGGVPYGTSTETGHRSGGMGCLTCTCDEGTGYATGPSIDQFIARRLFEQGDAPVLRAPVFSIGASGVSSYAHSHYESAGEGVPLVNDPVAAYGSLFSDLDADAAALLIARKKSVLDVSYGECKGYIGALPSEGRTLVDYHCERIRELEQNLQVFNCVPPADALAQVSGLDHDDPNNYPVLTDFFWQMMETALLCDATRVASLSFGNTAFRFSMPWLDAPLIPEVNTGEQNVRDHHSHTHAGTRETVGLFMRWYAQKIAEFITRLGAVQPDGSRLLDTTTVLLVSEYGSPGGAHSNSGCASFVFGSAGGQFATGRHFALGDDAANTHALMVSLIQAMGVVDVDQFGHPGGGSGRLDAMFA
ncbi:MAG: DUF1552 domain-containing protein [Deltaproteobacteria bacterium]|nr:DUF1552 domain-containing protein [Deltaproteobacteria bacterium]MBK8235880.1 DUF1552 domain-containing protein [Deltaproteobacteria bacterium]MBK8713513.1 DUF1552 domain-containing protein [Deltaproteobacteria bacterium]MBP7289947.1 DUF1552 domain-containing protein [Nannocystaceae bacterium]